MFFPFWDGLCSEASCLIQGGWDTSKTLNNWGVGRWEVFIAPPSSWPTSFSTKKARSFVERLNFPQIMSHGSGKCWPNLSKKGTFLLQVFHGFSIWGEIPPLPPKSCECYICWNPKTARTQCFRCLTVDFRFFLKKNRFKSLKKSHVFSMFCPPFFLGGLYTYILPYPYLLGAPHLNPRRLPCGGAERPQLPELSSWGPGTCDTCG